MKDLGLVHYFLGIQVQTTESCLFLSQERNAKKILDKAKMLECKPLSTPMVGKQQACENYQNQWCPLCNANRVIRGRSSTVRSTPRRSLLVVSCLPSSPGWSRTVANKLYVSGEALVFIFIF